MERNSSFENNYLIFVVKVSIWALANDDQFVLTQPSNR